jgi:hypothetical protein
VTDARAGVINRERQSSNQQHQPRSNKRVQPTPLRVPKIGAILTRGCSQAAFPIHHGGAADAQSVSRSLIQATLHLVLASYKAMHKTDS